MSQYHKLYTHEDSAVVFIDHQPQMTFGVASIERPAPRVGALIAKKAKDKGIPVVGSAHSTKAYKNANFFPTAATDYFKGKTTPELTTAFTPVVEKSMSQVGVTQQYEALLGRAKAIPFLNTESYDINHYVVGKSLDGLFHVVGEQEAQIRANPAARTTALLQEVFGRK